eukprot:9023078-Alexandrium_andersonii.AAC.1
MPTVRDDLLPLLWWHCEPAGVQQGLAGTCDGPHGAGHAGGLALRGPGHHRADRLGEWRNLPPAQPLEG